MSPWGHSSVPGTFFCAGDIRGQKLVPKGTILRGTNVGDYVSMGIFVCAGDIRGQKLVPKGTI